MSDQPTHPVSRPFSLAAHILLVEDDPDSYDATHHALKKHGLAVTGTAEGDQAWNLFEGTPSAFDAVVTDIRMGDCSGIELLRRIRQINAELPVILITGFDSIESAIEAVRLGAQDYIVKPMEGIEDLLIPLERAIRNHRTTIENRALNARLAESEKRFRAFFENEPGYCYMVSPDGLILDVNRAALAALGYEKSELMGQPVKRIYAPEDLERASSLFSQWGTVGLLHDEEISIVGKTGQKRLVLLNASAVRDDKGAILHSVSIQCDITERKNAETELLRHRDRLRQLSMELTLAEEKQRRRIAVDLHDGLAVDICCAKRHILKVLESKAGLSPDMRDRLEKVEGMLSNSLECTRTLMFDLFPPSLFTAGLPAALEDLAEHSTHKWGFHAEVKCPDECERIQKDDRMLLYRAVRELLENVGKHAQARNVVIVVSHDDSLVAIEVRDDGKGFDPSVASIKGIGLLSIRERMLSLGGSCKVDSVAGKGTTVRVTMPAHIEVASQ